MCDRRLNSSRAHRMPYELGENFEWGNSLKGVHWNAANRMIRQKSRTFANEQQFVWIATEAVIYLDGDDLVIWILGRGHSVCSSFSSSVFTKRCLGSRPRNQKAAFQWKGCNFAFCLCAFYECRESPAKAVPSTRIYYVDHNPFANDTVFAGESKELKEELKARIGKEENHPKHKKCILLLSHSFLSTAIKWPSSPKKWNGQKDKVQNL